MKKGDVSNHRCALWITRRLSSSKRHVFIVDSLSRRSRTAHGCG
jgi:hypothetical protein